MKIKKNGQVIRLTESDLQRIVKRVLKEGIIINDPNSMEKKLENKCINLWKRSPGKKGKNNNSDWDETWRVAGIEARKTGREDNWGDKLVINLDKKSGCTNMEGGFGSGPEMNATLTLVCDGQRDADSYAFTLNLKGSEKTVYNQGVSNVIKSKEWCEHAGVGEPSGDVEDEFASTGEKDTNIA